jgi:hypothetical protein
MEITTPLIRVLPGFVVQKAIAPVNFIFVHLLFLVKTAANGKLFYLCCLHGMTKFLVCSTFHTKKNAQTILTTPYQFRAHYNT